MSNYLGQLMLDVAGLSLSAEDRTLLQHAHVGGLILFTRNFATLEQLVTLIKEVRIIKPNCLIAVDHEGGRVQRFRQGFTHIPAMAKLGQKYEENSLLALAMAERWGWLMAAELRAVDVDFSFAPVLDRDHGVSAVIGDRAFSANPEAIVALSSAFVAGMHRAGMAATGKHFPGHGAVVEDSHVAIPVDCRAEVEIEKSDMAIFHSLIETGLEGIMPAHVIYDQVDAKPAGFSAYWLQSVLRQKLGFDGVIFSDDLSMEGASVEGSFAQRAEAALRAGCDMVLVCNHRAGAIEVLKFLEQRGPVVAPDVQRRLNSMRGKRTGSTSSLAMVQASAEAREIISEIRSMTELPV